MGHKYYTYVQAVKVLNKLDDINKFIENDKSVIERIGVYSKVKDFNVMCKMMEQSGMVILNKYVQKKY